MSDHVNVLVRNAREQDLPAVAEIEAASPGQTAAGTETHQQRLTVFPNGFFILVAGNEIAGYGCSEKRLDGPMQQPDSPPAAGHKPDGKLFFITALAVKKEYRGRGYRSMLLEKLIEMAHLEGCRKVLVETAHEQDLYRRRGFQVVQQRQERGHPLEVLSLDLAFISRIP